MGRHKKYEDPAELEAKGTAWIDSQLATDKPLTITGLGRALGFAAARDGLADYAGRPEYADVIKRLRSRVEQWLEERIHTAKIPAGPIFAAKNIMGWTDHQQVLVGGVSGPPIRLKVNFVKPKPEVPE